MSEDQHSIVSGGEDLAVDESGTDDYDDGRQEGIKPRILLMGPRRSGKTSIQRVVFYKMSPHETMFLEPTTSLDIKYVANNDFSQFQIWDFPGDHDTSGESLMYGGEIVDSNVIFGAVSALVLVVDAQDDPIQDTLHRLVNTVRKAYSVNANLEFEVFIHKVDGDLYLTDQPKDDCLREVQAFITRGISQYSLDIKMSYYLTSIYDHSIFDAISKVVQKLIPQLPTLENLLNCLISNCMMEKSFLFDVVSRIYIATDSNPVHMATYELCCDMIDVAIDVSCIYGVREEEGKETDRIAYDDQSASIIRLSNGTVLYLRQVGSYLALVCLMQAEHFNNKEGVIEYNINCFKQTLAQVFQRPLRQQMAQRAGASPGA